MPRTTVAAAVGLLSLALAAQPALAAGPHHPPRRDPSFERDMRGRASFRLGGKAGAFLPPGLLRLLVSGKEGLDHAQGALRLMLRNLGVAGPLKEGTLAALSGTSLSLTSDGTTTTYTLASDVTVVVNGRAGSLADLAVGERVLVGLDAQGDVALVLAILPRSAGGTVTAIGTSSITIAPTTGEGEQEGPGSGGTSAAPVTYPLAADVSVIVDGTPASLSDVAVGERVELDLNASGQVTRIVVRARAVVGVVTSVTTSTIAVEPAFAPSGTTVSATAYTLAQGAPVTFQGAALPETFLAAGDLVRLAVSGETVTAVRLLGIGETLTGTVEAVLPHAFLLQTDGVVLFVRETERTSSTLTTALTSGTTVTVELVEGPDGATALAIAP